VGKHILESATTIFPIFRQQKNFYRITTIINSKLHVNIS